MDDNKKYHFHLCSLGLKTTDLFKDPKDCIAGINKFAVAFKLFGEDVEVLVIVIVSTHFHAYVYGTEQAVKKSADRFARIYSMHYSNRYGVSKVLKGISIKMCRCDSLDYRKNIIGYTLNNPRKHHETQNPFLWPWSSVSIYFDERGLSLQNSPRILPKVQQWQMRQLLGTHQAVPETWQFYENGMVTFQSFVNPKLLENEVGSMNSLSFLINKSTISESEGEAGALTNDKQTRELALRISPGLFSGLSMDMCDPAADDSTRFLLSKRRKVEKAAFEKLLEQLTLDQMRELIATLRHRYGVALPVIRRLFPADACPEILSRNLIPGRLRDKDDL